MAELNWQKIGPYRGLVYDAARYPEMAGVLAGLAARLESGPCDLLQGGRHQTFRLALACGGETLDIVVKRFGRQSAVKDRWAEARGTKASRTYFTAAFLAGHGIGTTLPVAFLERWERHRLVESHFISFFLADAVSFKDVLLHLFFETAEAPEAADFLAVMKRVASGIRRLHDAGCRHNDLGNQNILVCGGTVPQDDGKSVAIIDLSRARCGRPLSIWARARDVSRVTLPSGFLQRFFEMYWRGPVPRTFVVAEQLIRAGFALHTLTRLARHPVRELRYRRRRTTNDAPQCAVYPRGREHWIWDSQAGQPLLPLKPFDRRLHTPPLRGAYRLLVNLDAQGRIGRQRTLLRQEAVAAVRPDAPHVAVVVGGTEADFQREAPLLRALRVRQVFLRFYHHESAGRRQARIATALAWAREGWRVSGGLVQSRAAVRDPEGWMQFCGEVLAALGPRLEWIEVGHAVDAVQWGVWGFDEYRRLMAGLDELARRHPQVRFVGPSGSLCDLGSLLPFLRQLPRSMAWHAVSLRLAPYGEGPSDAVLVDSLVFARAIARSAATKCGDGGLLLAARADSASAIRRLKVALDSGMVQTCVIETDLTDAALAAALRDWR